MAKKINRTDKLRKKLRQIDKSWYIFILILIVFLYLRFWNIIYTNSFGWDQARESWSVRDILKGQFYLTGFTTGVGHLPIAPLFYYFLVPFYAFFHLDPVGAIYFNIIENIINLWCIFFVTKKIFNTKAAIFAAILFSTCQYLIVIGQVAWNVTLLPGISAFIFYSVYKIYEGKYKWIFAMWTLCGFAYNFHFTALFYPLIGLLSLVFVKNRKLALKYSLYSIPLYLVWFIPVIIFELQNKGGGASDFFKNYFLGNHPRYFLYHFPQTFIKSLVMFKVIIGPDRFFEPATIFQFAIPLIFLFLVLFFEKDVKKKVFGYLLSLWFIIPLLGFSLYNGPLTEYYFLYQIPMVIFILIYIQQKLLSFQFKRIIYIILIIFWLTVVFENTKNQWIKPTAGGLYAQKKDFAKKVKLYEQIPFSEGDIESYMWAVYKENHILIK